MPCASQGATYHLQSNGTQMTTFAVYRSGVVDRTAQAEFLTCGSGRSAAGSDRLPRIRHESARGGYECARGSDESSPAVTVFGPGAQSIPSERPKKMAEHPKEHLDLHKR